MKIFNTLTGKKEELKTPTTGGVNLFVCGPTVYDYSHIGHARTYIFFDIFVKFLRQYYGWKINYLQNITDIDDRIINRALEQNKNWQELADFFEKAYLDDVAELGVSSVDTYAPATKYIPEIISQVERLIKKGYAYVADGSVYFDVRKFTDYGKLSHQKLAELKAGVRVETEPGKKFFADFALWKASKPNEPTWASPWGEGRPGWHIEDTAITEKNFGPRYTIHGGGLDLIFPHHEAEIAQMEAVSGLQPLAQIWMHTGMLLVEGEKMSKSLNNFITIRDFLKNNPATTLRYMVASVHYRTSLDFSKKVVEMAEHSIARIKDFTARLASVQESTTPFPIEDFVKPFWKHLADDFNTPQALASLFELIKESNKFIDTHNLSQRDAQKIIDFINQVNDILGILPAEEEVPTKITALVKQRNQAREQGDYISADKLREKIEKLGWSINDTSTGTRLTKN